MEVRMTAVTIGVASEDETRTRIKHAFEGREQGAFISFASLDLLWKVIMPRRWQILRAMAGKGPLAIRAVARLVGRDVKSVHGDVHALLRAGVLDRVENGQVEFPFDTMHVDFV